MTVKDKNRYIDLRFAYFGGPDDGVVEFQKVKVVKTRSEHECACWDSRGFPHKIPAQSLAVSDTAKYDGKVGTCYSCLPCLDRFDQSVKGLGREWVCHTCGTEYAEYENGCPHCWNAGLRSKVVHK